MSLIKVKNYLKNFGLDKNILEFDKSSATVKEAAIAIGCTEAEIAKTLSFVVGENPILIVASGDKKIDGSKYKTEFLAKSKMIPIEDVERLIGHPVGGVCPFGINENVLIYLDVSLKRFDYVYPACGSSNSAIKLSIDQLEQIINFHKWVDVCKSIDE